MKELRRLLKSFYDMKPKMAIILGSGLGEFADTLDKKVKIAAAEIPGYPKSTVEGHQGFLVGGYYNHIPILAVQGRTHYYEGYSAAETAFIVDILNVLEIKLLLVTNAAGAVNERFHPGDLMLITDQINMMFANPLTAKISNGRGQIDYYATSYFNKIEKIAIDSNIMLKRGVLCASSGPSYETAAEVKMIRSFGGDAVSMSTIPEVIMANRHEIETIGISCITNYATGVSKNRLSHQEVTATANRVRTEFTNLVRGIIENLVF
jgi:purine-nucleoside phosphorylase